MRRSFVTRIIKVGDEFGVIFPDNVVKELNLRGDDDISLSISSLDNVEFVK